MADSIIGTKNVWPYYSSNNVSKAGTTTSGAQGSLGKDDFLKILITQLKNQDPMQPLEDKEFIAQMAQFTSVEQLTNMSGELKQLRQSLGLASGLIGKTVTYTATNAQGKDEVKTGTVESIIVKSGEQYAKVSGTDVSLDKISGISNPEGS
ncbi:hypothetical protein LJK88_22240 [Paenibacillus sp. P26]|nr:hypothetical protein LJK88_22240 [Paenibacillus sp. P26]UUZ95723.1 hypothetical protein LJK87_15620 [Paenibacillus sp. P25]